MTAQIAKREISHIEATPALPGIGELLDRYMWVHTIAHDPWQAGIRIEGNLKPDISATEPAALRRAFYESFEAVTALLESAGARWEAHPMLMIGGDVEKERDGSRSFRNVEARVEFRVSPSG